jgi:hypothetical protein
MMPRPLEVRKQHDRNEVSDREAVGGRVESHVSATWFGRKMVTQRFRGALVEQSTPGEFVEELVHAGPPLW